MAVTAVTVGLWPGPSVNGPGSQVVASIDLLSLAPQAAWNSDVGPVRWDRLSEATRGFVAVVDSQPLASGPTARVLKTHPNHARDGFVEGTLSLPRAVRSGDHFVTSIGFYLDRPPCYSGDVVFRAYAVFTGRPPGELINAPLAASSTQQRRYNIDLTPFAGAIGIRLRVDARDAPTCDWGAWWDTTVSTYH